MQRTGLVAVLVILAAGYACGQQATAPSKAAGSAAAAAKSGDKVTVYLPKSPVKEPQLLPMANLPAISKKCSDPWSGEPELSLLVDTEGRPRNVMFLKPVGSVVDRLAVAIAKADRFTPGTLNGKPVVVAESLKVKIEACAAGEKRVAAGVEQSWELKSLPKQKLQKPKDPPQVAELAPLEIPQSQIMRKVDRPDFFGNGESAPVLLYSQYASYTPSRAEERIKGVCQVSLVVDPNGLPEDLHVLKGIDPGLDMSALLAVERYRFFPAIKDDKPVPAAVVVSVNFVPPGESAD
jgi:TonB family protein